MALEELKDQTLELLFQQSIDSARDLIEIVREDCPRKDMAISSDSVEVNGKRVPTLEIIIDDLGESDLTPPPIGAVICLRKFGFLGEFYEKSRYGEDGNRVVIEAPISTDQTYK